MSKIYRLFFSFFVSLSTLLIISFVVLKVFGHRELSEWIIYFGSSFCVIIVTGIILRPKIESKTQNKPNNTILISNKLEIIISLLLSLIIISFATRSIIEAHHYSYYVGPAYEISLGKSLLGDVPSQYGYLSIHFVKSILEPIGINIYNFHFLNRTLFILYFIGFWFVYIKLTYSPLVSLLLTSTTAFFQTLLVGSTILYPSTGPLRFGFGLIIILAILYIPKKYNTFFIAFLSAISMFWSAETALYTIPAYVLLIGIQSFITQKDKKKIITHFFKNISIFIAISLIIFTTIIISEYVSFGRLPSVLSYFDFALIYTRFGTVPIPIIGNYYPVVLILVAGVSFAFNSIYQKEKDETAMSLYLIGIHNIAIFSYFIGRSLPSNILNIAPFILLQSVILYRIYIRNFQPISKFIKLAIMFSFLTIFSISANNIKLIPKAKKISPKLEEYKVLKNKYSLTDESVIILSARYDTEIITENKIKTYLPLNPSSMTTLPQDYTKKYLLPNLDKVKPGTIMVYTDDSPELFSFFNKNFTLYELDPDLNEGLFKLYKLSKLVLK